VALRTWLLLLFAQTIWAGSYTAMKLAVAELPVGAVVFLRYGLATLGYLAILPKAGLPRLKGWDWALAAVIGAVVFALAPTMQVESLRHTQAADVSILVALEPVLTALLAALILREKLQRSTVVALALGVAGLLVLSGGGWSEQDSPGRLRLWGNLLFAASLVAESAVTVAGGRLARRYPALSTMALMKSAGFVTAALVYWPTVAEVDFAAVSTTAWASLLYLALVSSLTGYTVWYYVIRTVPVQQAALTLFVQPVIGAFFGWAILSEQIGWRTFGGAALVCGGFALLELSERRKRRRD